MPAWRPPRSTKRSGNGEQKTVGGKKKREAEEEVEEEQEEEEEECMCGETKPGTLSQKSKGGPYTAREGRPEA